MSEARLTAAEIATARTGRIAAMRLHEIEGNPLHPDEIEMFKREAWTHDQRWSYILRSILAHAAE